ncbi:zinc ABC transporter substrate-binding lipoprotein AdcA [Staphylococcus petrasii]|uniref:Zinc ABC transporter substrate-binding lipoprotein AdcA n=1 Tax=Staphylococcus petrasii TaxID=1276936 RepID=A0ABY2KYA8_9STAP|nr:zinc ABC transporter substrate-binding lipoprotein AdcA [Staphylococcus petrasii]TGE19219.1 zinc ABC transporter substrate-binding lipoprotein AdcA [Staphylococcus petrasii]
MKKVLSISILVTILVLSLVACGKSDRSKEGSSNKDGKINVSTTVYPLQSFIQQIGGNHVNVSSIYPAGTDLHDYEPTQKDILKANKSDLFVYTGDDLDPVAKKIASTIKEDKKKLSLQKGLDKSKLLTDQHEHGDEDHEHEKGHEHHHHGGYDPHVWLDPKMDEVFAKEIKNQLIKKDPQHKEEYEKNYKKLMGDLNNIDASMKEITKDKQGNAVFISHESLGYIANRYGFVQKGIQNMNAEDPSQKELTNLVKEIKNNNVKYILYEDNVANKVTETIRKETNAEPLKFYNMESLNKEQLKDKSISYQKLMHDNIKALDKALNTNTKLKDPKAEHKYDKAISEGYFKDNQVKDRQLSDYAGKWQSVYPYLKNGDLDEVMKHKAENDSSKSAREYKKYYENGYKTDISNINIEGNHISFTKNGKTETGEYEYVGYKILDYKKGNRGVRYIFKLVDSEDKNNNLPTYVQFSDHNIYPKKAEHFHIFMGNDNNKLLKEMDHWPTYYPAQLNKEEIEHEMLEH